MKKHLLCVSAALVATMLLAGCGFSNSITKEGMDYINALDYPSAMHCFDEAENAGENARLIARGRGIASMGMADYDKAIQYFKDSLALSSGFVQDVDIDINCYLAAAYVKMGEFEQAESCYDAILDLRENADVRLMRGVVRLGQGAYTAAKEDFDYLMSKNSQDVDLALTIYREMAAKGYADAGDDLLKEMLNENGKDMTDLQRGKINYYLGNYQVAAVALEGSRKDNNDADSCLYLGMAYEAMGEFNYASNVYESYLAVDENSPKVYNQMGLCQMKMGNYKAALSYFQDGMKLEDDSMLQTMSYNEIVAYEYMGDFRKAEALIERYLASYPDDEAAKREQKFLASR